MPTYVTMASQGGIRHSITSVIKLAFCTACTAAEFFLEVCVSVNLAYAK